MHASIGADLEIEQRLDRYAQVRLSPSSAAVARMRARVMREARLGFAEMTQAAAIAPARSAAATVLWDRRRVARRAASLVAAASLSLALAAGAMAASQAGGPLYETRLWLEGLALPSDASSRADAEVARLESRLAEVVDAAESGDSLAVAAALDAYDEIANEALAAAGTDAAALERIRAALDRHVAVLETVAAKVPLQAREAIERNIERAIVRNDAVIQRIDAATPPPAVTQPNGNPTAEKTPKPAATPASTATDKPEKTPKPTAAPTPVVTVPSSPPQGQPSQRPDRTPPAHRPGAGAGAP